MLDNVKEIHIEPTSLCNAECPMCARNINGKGLNPHITLRSLDVKWFEGNLQADKVKKLNKVFFCGRVGDPAATPELLEIITYLKKANPNLIIGVNTNGGLKNPSWWTKLGNLLTGPLDYCVFSIDGLEDTNHLYRRNVRWSKVMSNAQAFISTGASAHWDMLIFAHNKHQIGDARDMADSMNFTWFRTKETDRWDNYTSDLGIHPPRHFTPPSYASKISCEKDRDGSVFLDYIGQYWPCCYMAEAYLNKVGIELHSDIRAHTNVELFTEYEQRLTSSNPFYIGKRACGTKGKKSQWKTEEQLR